MSNQDFSEFEKLNAQIDIWIDEEEYDKKNLWPTKV